jgi:type I restriction enzyme, R subunit
MATAGVDKLVYVNNVIKGKLLESEVLVQQATNNTKEQFANSPNLANGIMNAIIDAFTAQFGDEQAGPGL